MNSIKSYLMLTSLIGSLIVLMVVNIALSSELTSLNLGLNASQHQADQLAQATSILRQELVLTTSLADLNVQAPSLGYTETISYHSIIPSHPVAIHLP